MSLFIDINLDDSYSRFLHFHLDNKNGLLCQFMECSLVSGQDTTVTVLVAASQGSPRSSFCFFHRLLMTKRANLRTPFSWFGKNSTQTKLHRLLGDIKIHMRLKVSGDRSEIRQSYIPTLFGRLVNPLQEKGAVSPCSFLRF